MAHGKVYVGDFVSGLDPKAESYSAARWTGPSGSGLDERTGKPLWSFEYPARDTGSFPAGPRVTPTVDDGRVFFVGTEGRLSCLDAETGKLVWQKDFPKDYGAKTPLWGFAGHPLVDGDKVICIAGGEGACVVAFEARRPGANCGRASTPPRRGTARRRSSRPAASAAAPGIPRRVGQRARSGDG